MNRLRREGCLSAGWAGSLHWTQNEEAVASITFRAETDLLRLSYRVQIGGGEWQDVAESIHIANVACHFGGTRPYFICPGAANGRMCGRQVAKLHGRERYFLCRHCYRLAYASQSQDVLSRAQRRGQAIRRRLGGDPRLSAPFPPKPRGMWQRTYERLREQAYETEMRADEAFILEYERLLGQTESRGRKRNLRR